MTIKEATKIVYVIKAAYPTAFAKYSIQDVSNLIEAWAMTLEDYSYSLASMGLKTYLATDTKGFPPSPGQVIDCISKLTHNDDMQPLEAWSTVLKAIRTMQMDGEVESFNRLTDECQKAVGSPSILKQWAFNTDSDTLNSVEQSHFISSYKAVCKRTKEDAQIPQSVKDLISKTNAGMIGENN